jgi:hypothetical protein
MALWSNTDATSSKPKNLSADEKTVTFGVSIAEAQNASNTAKGINTPGWVKYTTYTDAQGNTRNKSEVLVAMGSISGDNDSLDPDPVITIATQPSAASVTSPDAATFVVATTVTQGGTATYQWQVSTDGVAWTAISGATSATLTVESTDPEYVTGNEFRVVVSVVGGTPVTSDAVALTVA